MQKKSDKAVHKMPADLRKALASAPVARAIWEDIRIVLGGTIYWLKFR